MSLLVGPYLLQPTSFVGGWGLPPLEYLLIGLELLYLLVQRLDHRHHPILIFEFFDLFELEFILLRERAGGESLGLEVPLEILEPLHVVLDVLPSLLQSVLRVA